MTGKLYCFTVQPGVDVKIEGAPQALAEVLRFGSERLPESMRICAEENDEALQERTVPFDVEGWHYDRTYRIPTGEYGVVRVRVRQRCAQDVLLPPTLLVMMMVYMACCTDKETDPMVFLPQRLPLLPEIPAQE